MEYELALSRVRMPQNEALVRQQLGESYARLGREAEALGQWKEAYQLEPSLEPVAENIGWVYLGEQRWAEAKTFLEQAVRMRPHSMTARFNLALALEELGEREDAERFYREILAEGVDRDNSLVKKSRRRLKELTGD